MKAYVFPGQGSQFSGMGAQLYDESPLAKEMFEKANDILGFRITDIMFEGSSEDLKQTKVTQPAVYLHSVILSRVLKDNFNPDMVAGHSLGELSALVSANVLSFEHGLKLVFKRALSMQKACDIEPSTMAAIIGLEAWVVEDMCKKVNGIVVIANYNSPGQIVISGALGAVKQVCEKLRVCGAKRALLLPVGGAFHSPLMESAREELATAIENIEFGVPRCPVYQNVIAKAVVKPYQIKKNLIRQLTSSVRWTQSIEQMIEDGAKEFIEVGPGKVLQGLISRIDKNITCLKAEL